MQLPTLVVSVFAGWFGGAWDRGPLSSATEPEPLHAAARSGNVIHAHLALLRCPDAVNRRERHTKAYFPTAVHTAAYWNNVGVLELLLARGGKAHYPGRTGDNGEPDESPLQYATRHNAREAAEALLRHGAPLDIFSAVALDKWDEVQRAFRLARVFGLHKRLANASLRCGFGRSWLLNWAINSGSVRTVRLLLDHGADVNPHKSRYPWYEFAPLAWAVSDRRLDIAAMLLERGAAVDAQNYDGYTALHAAVARGDMAGARFLLARGARLDTHLDYHAPRVSDLGTDQRTFFTPLHTAARNADPVMVALLLACGADPNARAAVPRSRKGPLFTTERQEDEATPQARAARGRTPLDVAVTIPDVWDCDTFEHKPGKLTAGRVVCALLVRAAGGVPGNPRP